MIDFTRAASEQSNLQHLHANHERYNDCDRCVSARVMHEEMVAYFREVPRRWQASACYGPIVVPGLLPYDITC